MVITLSFSRSPESHPANGISFALRRIRKRGQTAEDPNASANESVEVRFALVVEPGPCLNAVWNILTPEKNQNKGAVHA
jgi:hypothetical protein